MPPEKFVGRERELAQLTDLLNKKVSSLAVVRGRRRVGKSQLIMEFARKLAFLRFTGLPPDKGLSAQNQRDAFALQLSQQTGFPQISSDDWSKLFLLLAEKIKTGRVIVLLDEITWMAKDDPTFLPKLQNAWEMYFRKNPKLILIICGSVSAWIEKNILNSTGFFGRVSLDLVVPELPLKHCNELLDYLGFKRSASEKITFLSLTGCIPWYLEQINPMHSAENNIKKLCFEPNALMLKEFQRVFHDLFGSRGDIYQKIIKYLVEMRYDYSSLAQKMGYSKSSAFTQYLRELETAGYIKKFPLWSFKTGKISKLSYYRIIDNYLRFYLKYIAPKSEVIEKGLYRDIAINSLPGWKTIMGLQFENIVIKNIDLIRNILQIEPLDIVMEGPYLQRENSKHKGCQIDYLIQTRQNTLFILEIKLVNNVNPSILIKEMKEKISKLSLPRGFAALPILIHFNNLESEALEKYFYKTIDFKEFLETTLS